MGGICTKNESQEDDCDITIEDEQPIKQICKQEIQIINNSEFRNILVQQRKLFPEEQIIEINPIRGKDYFSNQSMDCGKTYTDVNLTPKGILKTHLSEVSRQRSQKKVQFNKISTKGVCFFRSPQSKKQKVTLSMLESIF